MKNLKEIKESIESLPKDELNLFRRWFSERDWQIWDEEIEEDLKSGKLDFLIEEGLSEKKNGKLRNI